MHVFLSNRNESGKRSVLDFHTKHHRLGGWILWVKVKRERAWSVRNPELWVRSDRGSGVNRVLWVLHGLSSCEFHCNRDDACVGFSIHFLSVGWTHRGKSPVNDPMECTRSKKVLENGNSFLIILVTAEVNCLAIWRRQCFSDKFERWKANFGSIFPSELNDIFLLSFSPSCQMFVRQNRALSPAWASLPKVYCFSVIR